MTEDPAGPRRSRARRVREEPTELEMKRRMQLPNGRQILEVTRRLVEQHGIEAASMREISRRAGLGTYSVAYYYGTKGRLLFEVVRLEHVRRIERLRQALQGARSRAEVVQGLDDVVRAGLDHEALSVSLELAVELAWRIKEDARLGELRANLHRGEREEVAELLGDKEREGVIRLSDVADAVAGVLLSLVYGVAVELAVDRGWRYERAIEHVRAIAETLILEPEAGGR